MQKDLCVVLITSYNYEKFISEAIESVLNQTYKNLKLVIVDDYSTDNSREIIKKYAQKYPDKVFYIFNEVNMHINRILIGEWILSKKNSILSFLLQ